MNSVVKHNLALMTLNKRGGMHNLIRNESMGGNAGSWNKYPCVGANFVFDPNTGEIKYFENIQSIPKKYRNPPYKSHIFRIAVNFNRIKLDMDVNYRILNLIPIKKATKLALINLELSIKEYNKLYGFKLPGFWNRVKEIFAT